MQFAGSLVGDGSPREAPSCGRVPYGKGLPAAVRCADLGA